MMLKAAMLSLFRSPSARNTKAHEMIDEVARGKPNSELLDRVTRLFQGQNRYADQVSEASAQISTVYQTSFQEMKELQEIQMVLLTKIDNCASSIKELEKSKRGISEIEEILKQVEEKMKGISDQMKSVQNLATRTSVIALNAAIESARAEGQGRSFAVVAEEVRALAEKSDRIVKEILGTLQTTQVSVQRNLSVAHDIGDRMRQTIESTFANFSEVADVAAAAHSKRAIVAEIVLRQRKVTDHLETTIRNSMESLSILISEVMESATGTKIRQIDPETVFGARTAFDLILDVRQPEEYNDEYGHIKHSTLVPLRDAFELNAQKLPRDARILVVCRSGGRSLRAAKILQSLGFQSVANMTGGMIEWNRKRLEVERRSEAS